MFAQRGRRRQKGLQAIRVDLLHAGMVQGKLSFPGQAGDFSQNDSRRLFLQLWINISWASTVRSVTAYVFKIAFLITGRAGIRRSLLLARPEGLSVNTTTDVASFNAFGIFFQFEIVLRMARPEGFEPPTLGSEVQVFRRLCVQVSILSR